MPDAPASHYTPIFLDGTLKPHAFAQSWPGRPPLSGCASRVALLRRLSHFFLSLRNPSVNPVNIFLEAALCADEDSQRHSLTKPVNGTRHMDS